MEIEEAEFGWVLKVDGMPIMQCGCHCAVKKFAQQLDRARQSSRRGAMQILTGDLGMCDKYADILFQMLVMSQPMKEMMQ